MYEEKLISRQDGSAKESLILEGKWICKKCKLTEIGSMETDELSAGEYKVTDSVKHVAFMRR